MINNVIVLMIEEIRGKRKISQENLTHDIIDPKQYRRYLNGTSAVPFDILLKLTNRLKIRFEDLMSNFYVYQFEETSKIVNLINLISSYDFIGAEKLINGISEDKLIQTENILMFKVSKLYYQFFSKKITRQILITRLFDLIDYDELMKSDVLSIAEMYILAELMDALDENKKMPIATKLNSLIMTQKYSDINVPNFIILRLIKYFYSVKYDDFVYDLCNKAIENCLTRKTYYLLDYFYYCLSVCENKKNKREKRDLAIIKCFSLLITDYNEATFNKFNELFLIDYGKPLKEIMKDIYPSILV